MPNIKATHKSIEMVDKEFMENVSIDKLTKCWNWIPKVFRFRHGYIFFNPRRYAVQMSGLTIPAGRNIMASCGNSKCVNPDHARLKHDGSALDRNTPLYFDLGHDHVVKDYNDHPLRTDHYYGHDFAYSDQYLSKKYHRPAHTIAKARRETLDLILTIIGSRLPYSILASTYKVAPSYIKQIKDLQPADYETFKIQPPAELHDDSSVDPRVYQFKRD